MANGIVYIGTDDNMSGGNAYALNASTGALIWKYPTGAVSNSPAVANGVVYFVGLFGTVYALNASTGAKLWSNTITNFFVESDPAVANGVLYIGSGDGSEYALNAATGAKLWSFDTGSGGLGGAGSPAVVTG